MASEVAGRRTQQERTDGTRRALVSAARDLFGERGYADVSTGEVAALAGVSKGALYHQFPTKAAVFEAVLRHAESEVGAAVAEVLAGPGGAESRLRGALHAFLAGYEDPAVRRIALLDGPAVLGWERWRAICVELGSAVLAEALQSAHDQGLVRQRPTPALVHLLLGALDEGVLFIAAAIDPSRAKDELVEAMLSLVLA